MTASERDQRIETDTIRDARDQLDRLLGAIRSGNLTAQLGVVGHLEGAIVALEALLVNFQPPPDADALSGEVN
jgi:surfactin synthase thioesterase subunit